MANRRRIKFAQVRLGGKTKPPTLSQAMADGVKFGCPVKLTPHQKREAIKRRDKLMVNIAEGRNIVCLAALPSVRRGVWAQMPEYTFSIQRGQLIAPDTTSNLPSPAAGQELALAIFADLARDMVGDLKTGADWRINVSDENGKLFYRVRIVAESVG